MTPESRTRSGRSKNPFESPSCPETYQQASCSPQSHELFHYISMTPKEFKQQIKDGNIIGPTPKSRSRISSAQTISSVEHEAYDDNMGGDDLFYETPCRQVAQLRIHDKQTSPKGKLSKKGKRKLLGSKSLSQLMSKLNRRSSLDNEQRAAKQSPVDSNQQKSHSAILPRQSTSNSLGRHLEDPQSSSSTMPNELEMSPIMLTQRKIMHNIVASTPSLPLNRNRESTIDCRLRIAKDKSDVNENCKSEQHEDTQQKEVKFKPFKNTALVLRDVKNSIRLRLKAKRENQEFEKLTNESMTTPSVKLYSPFNIYTPSLKSEKKGTNLAKRKEAKLAKKRLNLSGNENVVLNQGSNSGSADKEASPTTNKSLKSKIALRHKKHLMQANKFAFDSPTGRLRETVKDVEQLQQCIEDISVAIKARSELSIDV